MLHERPASCNVSAALSPAIPAPTIAIRDMVFLLILVVLLETLDGNVGHSLPGIVDTNEEEQNCHCSDAEECWNRIDQKENSCDEQYGVRDERKNRMPQPIFQHRLIVSLTVCS